MKAVPKILFLSSESPHSGAAGAIVFHRLFQTYPTEQLVVVTNNLPPANAGRLECRYVHLPLKVDRLNRTRLWRWRTAWRVLGGANFLNLNRIDQALGNFEPELVVTLMQDSWYYDYAARYARQRGLPLIVLVHDLPSGFEPVSAWLRDRQQRRDAQVYRQAVRRLCISESMVQHFNSTIACAGEVLPPPRADAPPDQNPEVCRQLKHPRRLSLGYAGGLHYGYGEQLLRLIPILRATGTVLEIFSPKPGGTLVELSHASDVLHFHGYAPTPEEAWRGLLARCDVVLQPYLNPPSEYAQQYRTHFPSKLGDVLSLGLPLLIMGPVDASGVAWCASRPGCALVVTNPEESAIITELQRLRDDAELRVQLARSAQSAANYFDATPLRERFVATLTDAAAAR